VGTLPAISATSCESKIISEKHTAKKSGSGICAQGKKKDTMYKGNQALFSRKCGIAKQEFDHGQSGMPLTSLLALVSLDAHKKVSLFLGVPKSVIFNQDYQIITLKPQPPTKTIIAS
jgi:hypothetical protein